ncbi:MAG TPA: non-homologous end-joining DNA ligase [Candidatus Dormibacteraeota bacterium]
MTVDTAERLPIELEEFPTAIRPMQAGSAEAPFSSPDYLFEVKWDGLRCLLLKRPGGEVRLLDRRFNDLTDQLPEVVATADRLPAATILDGELVATDPEGRPDLERLRKRLGGRARADVGLSFIAFDLLWLDGKPQLRQPLVRRKQRLRKAVGAAGAIVVPDHIEGEGVELFEACLERGLEGVMAKHRDSTYVPGQRSPFWLKVKAVKSDDFVVTGWLPSEGADPFGALLVGFYERGRLLPCGAVVGGFDAASTATIAAELRRLEVAESPLDPAPVMMGAPVHWVRPELVISVRYSDWAPDGTLRFPIFNGLRADIHPAECVRHRPRVVIAGRTPPGSPAYGLTRFPF